eukprot:5652010-Alexandrium_andersonii.AAC.1
MFDFESRQKLIDPTGTLHHGFEHPRKVDEEGEAVEEKKEAELVSGPSVGFRPLTTEEYRKARRRAYG